MRPPTLRTPPLPPREIGGLPFEQERTGRGPDTSPNHRESPIRHFARGRVVLSFRRRSIRPVMKDIAHQRADKYARIKGEVAVLDQAKHSSAAFSSRSSPLDGSIMIAPPDHTTSRSVSKKGTGTPVAPKSCE